MSIARILAGAAALAALGGCQTLEQMQPGPARAVAAPSHPTYCYRTLAAVNCYLAPRPGDTLVGVDVPPPAPPVVAKQAPEPPPPAATVAPPTPAAAVPPPAPPQPVPVAAPAAASPPPAAPAKGPAQLSPYGNGPKRTQPPAAEAIYGYPSPPPAPPPAQ